jgi:hypothetical protein
VKALLLIKKSQFQLLLVQEDYPSINQSSTNQLLERYFTEKIPQIWHKAKPQKRCAVCFKRENKRKETTYWCPDCEVSLGFDTCFKEFHTVPASSEFDSRQVTPR